jgi:CDP-diacylglycerol--glycerol-3-phosphate 3-phosphatidyltransferase
VSETAGGRTAPRAPAAPSNWNLANGLTLLRLLLVPFFVWFLLEEGGEEPVWRIAAFVVFVLAAITDRIDGELARRWGQVTDFGKLVDPIADKALTGAAFVVLSYLGELSWWVTIVVSARELGITLLRLWVLQHGVMAASRGGKIKTVLQATALSFYILPLSGVLADIGHVLMAAAVAVTVLTGLDYVAQALRNRQERAQG